MGANVKGIFDLLLEGRGRNYYLRITVSQHDEVIVLKRHPYTRVFVNANLYVKLYEVLRLKDHYLPVPKDRPLSYPFPLKCKGRHFDFAELVSDTLLSEVWVDLSPSSLVIAISTFVHQPPFDFVRIGFGDEGNQLVAKFWRAEKGLRPWEASLPSPIPYRYGAGAYPVKIDVLGDWEYQYVEEGLFSDKIQAAREQLWKRLVDQFGKDSPQVKEGLTSFAEGILAY